MTAQAALLAVFHQPLADLIKHAPARLRDDLIGEAWICLAEAAPGESHQDIYRRSLSRAIRATRSAGAVSLDAEAADALAEAAEAGAEALAEVSTTPTRYRHYIERIRRPGETRRAAEIRLKKMVDRYRQGDLFLDGEEVAV